MSSTNDSKKVSLLPNDTVRVIRLRAPEAEADNQVCSQSEPQPALPSDKTAATTRACTTSMRT